MDGQDRPQGRLLFRSHRPSPPPPPSIPTPRCDISIQLPSLWSGISTLSVYQDIETNCSLAQAVGLSNDQLYKRQPTNSQLGRGGSIDGRADCDSHGKTGIHSELRQICT